MEITAGFVVYSKAGRDKGKKFLVLSLENNFAYIADGDLRKVAKAKKKKLMHLQKTNCVFEIEDDITDSGVRKLLARYKPVQKS